MPKRNGFLQPTIHLSQVVSHILTSDLMSIGILKTKLTAMAFIVVCIDILYYRRWFVTILRNCLFRLGTLQFLFGNILQKYCIERNFSTQKHDQEKPTRRKNISMKVHCKGCLGHFCATLKTDTNFICMGGCVGFFRWGIACVFFKFTFRLFVTTQNFQNLLCYFICAKSV